MRDVFFGSSKDCRPRADSHAIGSGSGTCYTPKVPYYAYCLVLSIGTCEPLQPVASNAEGGTNLTRKGDQN